MPVGVRAMIELGWRAAARLTLTSKPNDGAVSQAKTKRRKSRLTRQPPVKLRTLSSNLVHNESDEYVKTELKVNILPRSYTL